MSQPYKVIDLTSMDLENFTPEQLNHLFNTADTGPAIQSFIKNEPTNDLDFDFGNSALVPTDSPALSLLTTPDLLNYNFGQPSSGYPTPGPSTPQPYPLEQQQYNNPILAVDLPYRQRPQVLRSQTNTSHLQPCHPPPVYTRRRSLSQGDVGDVAVFNATHAQEPQTTFFRMQAPRHNSTVPNANPRKRRAGHRQTRSASQGPNSRRDHTHDDDRINVPGYIHGQIPTRLGDPISPNGPYHHRPTAQHAWPPQHNTRQPASNEVMFSHMTRPEDLDRSQRIIQIGALTVTPQHDSNTKNDGDTILKKLEDVERYLSTEGDGDCSEALRGCATIREALMRKRSFVALPNGTGDSRGGPTATNAPDAPSIFMAAQGHDIFAIGDSEDGHWLDMVMKEHRSPDFLNTR